jgi:pyruvyltransferase
MAPILMNIFDIDPILVEPSKAELIGVGSIIDAYSRRFRNNPQEYKKWRPWRILHIWGSGFLSGSSEWRWPQRLRYNAVRGPLTAARLCGDCKSGFPLGDPGILLPLFWPFPPGSTAKAGIVPHCISYKDFCDKYATIIPKNFQIINLLEDPKTIAHQIASSEFIISSSLHGLITADSYGVPSAWMASPVPLKGDSFKFYDYFLFRGKPIPGPIDFNIFLENAEAIIRSSECEARPATEAKKRDLIRAFPYQ